MKKGNVRSFRKLLGLGIITLGFYILYWLHINLKEFKEAFPSPEQETIIDTTQKLLAVYIVVTIVISIITIALVISTPNPDEIPSVAILLSLIGGSLGAIFFYNYTASVVFAQQQAQLSGFAVSIIYSYYLVGLIVAFIGNFIPILSLAGTVSIFVYFYKIQKEINKIWTIPYEQH
jgi:hypothetical protein